MRLILERWYIGPIVGVILLYVCWTGGLLHSQSRIADSARAKLDRIYYLASQGKFDQILAEGLASKESVKYLRLQDACLGTVETWEPNSMTAGTFDQTWEGDVTVRRRLGTFTDHAAGPTPHEIHLSFDAGGEDLHAQPIGDVYAPERYDWGNTRYPQYGKPITSEAEALDAARPIIHQLDAEEHILPGLKATRSGDFWIVEEHVELNYGAEEASQTETRYLVLWKGGDAIERVRAQRTAG